MKPTLLVLAAGMGSRYGGLKQMDGLGPNGETIIDYSIYDAVNAGFGKVVYIVREYFREQFEQTVKEKYSGITCPDGTPLEFDFVIQELNKIPSRFTLNPERQKPWGTAHAVLMAKDVIHEPFAVINGDDYYGKESFRILGDWLRAHEGATGTCSIVGFELDNTLSEYGKVSRGICYYDKDLHLTGIAEHLNIGKEADGKVYGDNSVNGETHVELDGKALCSMNMWGFTPDYFQLSEEVFTSFLEQNINELKKEYYIPYAVDVLMKERGYKCEVLSTDSHWFGVTYKEEVMSFLRPRKVEKNYDLFSGCAWYTPGVAGVFAVLGWFLAGMILGSLVNVGLLLFAPGFPLYYSMLIIYPVQFIPVLMYVRLKSMRNSTFDRGYSLDSKHFGPIGGALTAILMAFGTIALALMLEPLMALMPDMDETLVKTMEQLLDGPLWVSLLSMCVFAPVLEEWMCRGIVLRGLLNYSRKGEPGEDGSRRGMNPALAIAISAIFFATIHGNLWQGISAFILGSFFGYVYYKTGSLKLTMLMHCVNNTVSVLSSKLPAFENLGADASLMDIIPTGTYVIIFIVSAAVLFLAVRYLSKISLKSVQGNCDVIPGADDIDNGENV